MDMENCANFGGLWLPEDGKGRQNRPLYTVWKCCYDCYEMVKKWRIALGES